MCPSLAESPWPDLLALLTQLEELPSVATVGILSNGDLLDEATAQQLAGSDKLARVQLSIEGATAASNDAIRGEGSFDSTSRALRNLQAAGIPTAFMMTLSSANVGEVGAVLDLLTELGADSFSVDRFIPEGQSTAAAASFLSREQLHQAYSALHAKKNAAGPALRIARALFALFEGLDGSCGARCSAGHGQLAILPSGDLYPCRRLPIPVGNVLEDEGFFKAWYASPVLWELRELPSTDSTCGQCELNPRRGGCHAVAQFNSGDFLGEDPHCWK